MVELINIIVGENRKGVEKMKYNEKYYVGQEVYTIDEYDMTLHKFTIEQVLKEEDCVVYKSVEWDAWFTEDEIFCSEEEAKMKVDAKRGK